MNSFDEPNPESHVERRLRDVPLPDGFVQRLRAAIGPADEELDAAIRRVATPDQFVERLREAVANEACDERLHDVRIPERLGAMLRVVPYSEIVRRRRRLRRISQYAAAAVWLLIAGTAYFAAVGGILNSIRPSSDGERDYVAIHFGPLDLESRSGADSYEREQTLLTSFVAEPYDFEFWPIDDVDNQHGYVANQDRRGDGGDALDRASSPLEATNSTSIPEPPLDWLAAPSRGVVGAMRSQVESGWQPFENALLLRVGPFGASGSTDESLPPLESIPSPSARGLQPPVSAPSRGAFDRSFLLARGVFPPSFPARDLQLAAIDAPLVTSSASWRRMLLDIERDRWPDPKDVRVEEFLAAWPYDFVPARPGEVAVRTAAGPSVFGDPRAKMLQIGVVAGELPAAKRSHARLTIALESSASMKWNGRWDRVREGIGSFARQLGAGDRLCVTTFAEQPTAEFNALGRIDEASLETFWRRVTPAGGADLPAGLRAAVSRATSGDDSAHGLAAAAETIALVTDGRARIDDGETATRLLSLVRLAAEQGVRLSVFDISGAAPDPWLAEIANAGNGDYVRLETAEELGWQLFRIATGHDGVVAVDAVLRVEFDPRSVYAYRLIGHEPTLMTGLATEAVERPLRAGEMATTLFEVWLHENDVSSFAWAQARWRDPVTGADRQSPRVGVSRLQVARSHAEIPAPLQAACVLAETADVLRRGVAFQLEGTPTFVARAKPASVAHVLDEARRFYPPWTDHPEFQSLLKTLDQIESAAR